MKNFSKLQRFLPVSALGVSILLHLAVFLAISGVILIQAVTPKVPFIAGEPQSAPADDISPPDLPDEPLPETPASDPAPADEPVPQLNLNQIVSPVASAMPTFTVAAPAAPVNSSNGPAAAADEAKPAKTPTGIRQMSNPFGSIEAQNDPVALTGYMYDFKQTPGRAATKMTIPEYRQLIHQYTKSGWPEGTLRKFFRVPQAVATYQFFIPPMSADLAPAAFKAEKFVEPRLWMIVYKGTFVSPVTGTYRFVGRADDILIVRLDDQNVLDGSLTAITNYRDKTPYKEQRETAQSLFCGEWFQLEAGKSYPLQVILGEEPGGGFHAYLLIQKKGQVDFSLFQMARTKMPDNYNKNWPPLAKQAVISRGVKGGEE